jgi:hypothetical protein
MEIRSAPSAFAAWPAFPAEFAAVTRLLLAKAAANPAGTKKNSRRENDPDES